MKMTVKHKKGNHYSSTAWIQALRNIFVNKKQPLYVVLRFSESCKYHIEGQDQDDINKVVISVDKDSLFGQNKNEHGLGWRYNPKKDLFESFDYKRVDGEVKFFLIGEGDYDVDIPAIIKLQYPFLKSAWFGGNHPAPNDMQYSLSY